MKHTAATRKKLSDMRRGERNPFYGKKHSPETRAKLSRLSREFNFKRQYTPRPQSVTVPSGIELGYLAGLIDGEGSITVRRDQATLLIYNTDQRLLSWLQEHVGGNVGAPDRRGRVTCWAWQIAGANDVRAVLTAVRPLLTAKAEACARVLGHLVKKYG